MILHNRVSIAHIKRTKGVKGWVRAEPLTPNLDRFHSIDSVVVQKQDLPDRSFALELWQREQSTVILKFVGVESPEYASEVLVKGYVTVSRKEVPKPPSGVHYVFDIVGCNVENTAGEVLGEVNDVMSLPSNDVYVINGPRGEILVPAVSDVVVDINTTDRRILVCGIEELMS